MHPRGADSIDEGIPMLFRQENHHAANVLEELHAQISKYIYMVYLPTFTINMNHM